jgi:ATP-dependent RNA helicase RhlE
MSFESLNLIEPILLALKEEGYTNPTPIQAQSIPIVLRGTDLLGCAQTGTGKTAAFTLPIIQLLEENKSFSKNKKIRALIVTPTRELAIQIGESFRAYARHTDLKYAVIFGGVGQSPQVSAIRSGADVVIATPGRLLDLMNQRLLSIADVEYFVLDEADRMLDMGFIHDVKKLLAALPHKRQSLFFSATMPPEIVKLAGSILKNPASVSVTPVSSTVEIINQSVYFVDKGNKNDLLLDILQDTSIKTALVFTRTKHGADKVVKMLLKASIKAEAIHGNKSQNARQTALKNFKAQTTRVLVATDIAARGIDIDELEFVINYELSNIAETYVHRIGRTGRAGAKGAAISFCDIEEKAYLKDIEKLIGKKIPVVEVHKYPMKVLHVEKAAKKTQGQQRQGGGSRPGAPAAASKDAKPARSFDKASSGRKWYGKKNTY